MYDIDLIQLKNSLYLIFTLTKAVPCASYSSLTVHYAPSIEHYHHVAKHKRDSYRDRFCARSLSCLEISFETNLKFRRYSKLSHSQYREPISSTSVFIYSVVFHLQRFLVLK